MQPLNASGFCATWKAVRGGERLFVKSLPAASSAALQAEADGLRALAATHTVAVPAVVDAWTEDAQGLAVLAMAWLDLGSPDAGFGERLGEALGALHAADIPEAHGRFGWRRDNFVGSTPQCNS